MPNPVLERVPPGWWLKLAKEIFVRANLDAGANDQIVNAFANLMSATAELIYESKGKPPSAAAVGIILSQKMLDQVKLLDVQAINCAAAVAGLALSTPQNALLAKGGPIGITVMVASLTLDGITVWGECNLAYLDLKGREKIRAFEKSLEQKRKRRQADVLRKSVKEWTPQEVLTFVERNMCEMPEYKNQPRSSRLL
jgi:hypothetical protein